MCYVQINNYRLRNSTGDQSVLVQISRSTIIYMLMTNCGGNPSSCAQNFAQLCKLHLIDIGKQFSLTVGVNRVKRGHAPGVIQRLYP